jgi:uncharacterized protein (DUF952 family)
MIFKIVGRDAWAAACREGLYRGSPDDLRDGFIHFSAPAQVKGTAEKHFRGQPDLVLVAFDEKVFGDALVWEPSRGGALFPHLYGTASTNLAVWEKLLPLGADGVPEIPEDIIA